MAKAHRDWLACYGSEEIDQRDLLFQQVGRLERIARKAKNLGQFSPAVGAIVLRQLPNLDWLDWGRLEPRNYLGDYSLRARGTRGLATALVSGPEEDLSIHFNPAIEPGQTVNVVFRGFNPQPSIY